MSTREDADLLTSAEVAAMFRVDRKTVSRWGTGGRLLRAPGGGGIRYYGAEVRALKRGESPEAARKLAEADRDRLAGGGL